MVRRPGELPRLVRGVAGAEGFATYPTASEGKDKGRTNTPIARQTRKTWPRRRRPAQAHRDQALRHPRKPLRQQDLRKGRLRPPYAPEDGGDELPFRGCGRIVSPVRWRFRRNEPVPAQMRNPPTQPDWFFDQWIYGAGYPTFEIGQRWDAATVTAVISVRQTQRADSLTGIFSTPVDILVWVGTCPKTYTEMITDSVHEFSYPAYREPKLSSSTRGAISEISPLSGNRRGSGSSSCCAQTTPRSGSRPWPNYDGWWIRLRSGRPFWRPCFTTDSGACGTKPPSRWPTRKSRSAGSLCRHTETGTRASGAR